MQRTWYYVEIYKIRGLRVNADKIKVMVLGGEQGLVWEVNVAGRQLENISKFIYVGLVLDESDTDGVEH